jgi:hypothetical protein
MWPYLVMRPFSRCLTLINTNSACGDSYKLHAAAFVSFPWIRDLKTNCITPEALSTVMILADPQQMTIRRGGGGGRKEPFSSTVTSRKKPDVH